MELCTTIHWAPVGWLDELAEQYRAPRTNLISKSVRFHQFKYQLALYRSYRNFSSALCEYFKSVIIELEVK